MLVAGDIISSGAGYWYDLTEAPAFLSNKPVSSSFLIPPALPLWRYERLSTGLKFELAGIVILTSIFDFAVLWQRLNLFNLHIRES